MTAIACQHLRFVRGGVTVLEDISLTAGEGRILCIAGPNGAGKSTLLKCILGLEKRWSGGVRIGERDSRALTRMQMARLLSYVPQAANNVFAFPVAQYVMLGRSPHLRLGHAPGPDDHRAVDAALKTAGVEHLRYRLVTELSGGETQLVVLAMALAGDAPVLVLDEPAASLDLANQARVLRVIRNLANSGRTIIMSTHLLEHAFLLDSDLAFLKKGRLVALGSPQQICTESNLTELFETPVRVFLTGSDGSAVGVCVPKID